MLIPILLPKWTQVILRLTLMLMMATLEEMLKPMLMAMLTPNETQLVMLKVILMPTLAMLIEKVKLLLMAKMIRKRTEMVTLRMILMLM